MIAALTRSFIEPSQLVNKTRMHLATMKQGLIQTSNFSCAKSNVDALSSFFELICITFRHMKSSTSELGLTSISFIGLVLWGHWGE